MMEVQICEAAVVAAESATTAGFLGEDPLHLLVSTGHGLADASFASPARPISSVERELCQTVTRARSELDRFAPVRRRRWSSGFHERMFAHASDALARARWTG